ncbi:hypothetical protein [Mucilaginibacter aquariorum]|uniref:Uncharacterized protein n=1 Tax=Mucilaginibacter aquariorum TaxID=2967225 RepID=A0ABT1SY67_9SPHI|nr:hypothetical protein [Mucilaginibacter aquariorum]MCQ6957301.1 hypothetical protein [Mucilaginibacter aquariorum]
MLNAISWQQYVTAVLLFSLAWYACVGLRYYRTRLPGLLRTRTKNELPEVASAAPSVMGLAKPETGTSLYDPEVFIFNAASPDDISGQTLPKGPSDDLLEEAKMLVDAFRDNDNKTEFIALFKLLLNQYEVFRDEISLPTVIRPLREFADSHLPFRLQETEWPLTF